MSPLFGERCAAPYVDHVPVGWMRQALWRTILVVGGVRKTLLNQCSVTEFDGFTLLRRPNDERGLLRASDAADELLVASWRRWRVEQAESSVRLLIVGDAFGALAVATDGVSRVSWSDSAVSHLATTQNLALNGGRDVAYVGATVTMGWRSSSPLQCSPGLPTSSGRDPAEELRGPFDAVLWRLPRAVDVLRFQALVIQSVVTPMATVWAAGMDKHVPPGVNAHLAELGVVTMVPGVKKAHIFRIEPGVGDPPIRLTPPRTLVIPEWSLELQGGPGVFAGDHLDVGARVLVASLPALGASARIADLGCGNGVVGIMARRYQPDAEVHFFDESHAAMAVARANVERNCSGTGGAVHFHVDDGMRAYDGPAFDAVLCNPPFHQHGTLTDAVAWQMFSDARDHLAPGGELWVVGNRHLGYHLKLRRLFGNCRQVGEHPKFVVLAARAGPERN